MEVEYQNTKKDHVEFIKLNALNGFKKRLGVVIVVTLLLTLMFSINSFNWLTFLIEESVSLIAIFSIFYFIPLLRSLIDLKKVLPEGQLIIPRKKLIITDNGLSIESENEASTFNWESIASVHSSQRFIYFFLADRKYLLLPKRNFTSESEIINFLGLVQNKIIKTGSYSMSALIERSKPPYLLGLLCIIPLIGAVVGFALLLYGIFKYKDKWLIIIGIAGIVWTVFVYSSLNYQTQNSKNAREGLAEASQMQINSLFKNIEFYKLKYGVYPDSLQQISKEDQMVWIDDPLQSFSSDKKKNTKFNYQKVGNHYYLFSSGIDGIPNTKDDIYPQVAKADSAKFGLIRKSY